MDDTSFSLDTNQPSHHRTIVRPHRPERFRFDVAYGTMVAVAVAVVSVVFPGTFVSLRAC